MLLHVGGAELLFVPRFCGHAFSAKFWGRGVFWRAKSEQSAKVFSGKIESFLLWLPCSSIGEVFCRLPLLVRPGWINRPNNVSVDKLRILAFFSFHSEKELQF